MRGACKAVYVQSDADLATVPGLLVGFMWAADGASVMTVNDASAMFTVRLAGDGTIGFTPAVPIAFSALSVSFAGGATNFATFLIA